MTTEQRNVIEKLLKADEVAVDTQTVEISRDEQGYPVFETRYVNAPTNYKLVRLIEPYKGAVLQDLDYGKETTV